MKTTQGREQYDYYDPDPCDHCSGQTGIYINTSGELLCPTCYDEWLYEQAEDDREDWKW